VNLNRITPKQKSMAPENCSATRAANPFWWKTGSKFLCCVSCCNIFISNGYNLTIGSDAQPNGQSVV
jgi:hypothetical protein